MKLFLIRHGESVVCHDADAAKRQRGNVEDAPLIDKGRDQMAASALALDSLLEESGIVAEKVLLVGAPTARTQESAEVIRETLGYPAMVQVEDFLTELGQGPLGNLTREQLVAVEAGPHRQLGMEYREALKSQRAEKDHYTEPQFPYAEAPRAVENALETPLLDYLVTARESGAEAVVMVVNAGTGALVNKLLSGHDEEWFSKEYAHPVPRSSITELAIDDTAVIAPGAFQDNGIVYGQDIPFSRGSSFIGKVTQKPEAHEHVSPPARG